MGLSENEGVESKHRNLETDAASLQLDLMKFVI